MLRYRHLPFFTLCVLAAACGGAGADGVDDQAQATHVTPDGSDFPGKLKVVAPSTSAAGRVTLDNGSATGNLATEIGPLSVGQHSVRLSSGEIDSTTTAGVASDATTTVTAALLSTVVVGAPATIGLGNESRVWEPAGASTPNWTSGYIRLSGAGTGQIDANDDGSAVSAVFPGHYVYRFGMLDGVEVDVTANNTYQQKIWDYSGRRVARIVAPHRDLPTAQCATGSYTVYGGAAHATQATFTLSDQATIEVGAMASLADQAYVLLLPAVPDQIPIPLGAKGAGPLDFAIARLDVDDVLVSHADGSTTKETGTYTVQKLATDPTGKVFTNGSALSCSPPTNTGVDLPRGRYRVTTSYSTVEAGQKSTSMDVDVQ